MPTPPAHGLPTPAPDWQLLPTTGWSGTGPASIYRGVVSRQLRLQAWLDVYAGVASARLYFTVDTAYAQSNGPVRFLYPAEAAAVIVRPPATLLETHPELIRHTLTPAAPYYRCTGAHRGGPCSEAT